MLLHPTTTAMNITAFNQELSLVTAHLVSPAYSLEKLAAAARKRGPNFVTPDVALKWALEDEEVEKMAAYYTRKAEEVKAPVDGRSILERAFYNQLWKTEEPV